MSLPRLGRTLSTLTVGVAVASLAGLPLARATPSASKGDRTTARAPASPRTVSALAGPACRFQPSARTTGAHGTLRRSGVTVLHDGQRLRNAQVSQLVVAGSHVRVSNVRVDRGVLVTGSDDRLDHITTRSIGVSSAQHVVVSRSNIGYSPDDALHVTSDRGRRVSDVRLVGNWVHDPRTVGGVHYDGVQVRGVDRLVVRCNLFAAGPYLPNYNAGVFLENANGGNTRVVVARNWIFGWAFSVMVASPSSAFVDNRVGGHPHWGWCLLLGGRSRSFTSGGNISTPAGRAVNLCGQG